MADALVIDVQLVEGWHEHIEDGPIVLVEPIYGSVATLLALDAGWESVEIAGDTDHAAPPIPLVSFEQGVPADAASARCRVRSDDLFAAADEVTGSGDVDLLLVGSPVNARPLASMIARVPNMSRITFLLAPSEQLGGETEMLTADAYWAAGMLIRILLEELDDRPSRLTDAAGIAVTIAQGAEDAAAQLSSGVRWRRHVERGGHGDDLRVASAIDSVGAVPRVVCEGEALIAMPWVPAAV